MQKILLIAAYLEELEAIFCRQDEKIILQKADIEDYPSSITKDGLVYHTYIIAESTPPKFFKILEKNGVSYIWY